MSGCEGCGLVGIVPDVWKGVWCLVGWGARGILCEFADRVVAVGGDLVVVRSLAVELVVRWDAALFAHKRSCRSSGLVACVSG